MMVGGVVFKGVSAGIDSMGMDVYSYEDGVKESEGYGMDDLE